MAKTGAFGIRRVPYRDGCMTCLECYRSWVEDITPSGRCPWEDLHSRDGWQDRATRKRRAVIGGLWG